MRNAIMLFAILIVLLVFNQSLSAHSPQVFAQGFSLRITTVEAPSKVNAGVSFTMSISVEWSGLQNYPGIQGAVTAYKVRVGVCEGIGTDCDRELAYAPSEEGEKVSPSRGSKTYAVQLTAPGYPTLWNLNVRFWVGFVLGTNMVWIGKATEEALRELSITVSDKMTLTVQIEPRKANVPISIDGASLSTDATGVVQSEIAVTGSHTIEVPSEIPIGSGTRVVFVKWTDGETSNRRTLVSAKDVTLTAQYKAQHLLTVDSPVGNPQGSGWYDEGSQAEVSVTSPWPMEGLMGTLGGKYFFERWTGDSAATTTSALINMNGPKTVLAEWRTDNTMPYLIIGLLAGGIIVVVFIIVLMKRKRTTKSITR